MHPIVKGLAAGAVGTELLNVATYLDMLARGRPPSSVPEDDVEQLLQRTGAGLGDGDAAQNRKSALATLSGYATGASVGLAYAAMAPLLRPFPLPLRAAVTGGLAMAATDTTSARLGTTDPSTWSGADWVADAIPHLAFGFGVAGAYDALS